MSIKRWAARRDAGESAIIDAARKLGWHLWQLDKPVDWLGLYHRTWYPVEIKTATGTYTKAQKDFMDGSHLHGGLVLTWRSVDDMIADTWKVRGLAG